MLTRQELTLLVAALQFWAEEMDPADTVMLAAYSGDLFVDRIWEPAEIQRLRTQLLTAQLRYLVCQPKRTRLQRGSICIPILGVTGTTRDTSVYRPTVKYVRKHQLVQRGHAAALLT